MLLLRVAEALFPEIRVAEREAHSLNLVPRIRMRGRLPPLLHTSSWRGS